MSGFQFKENMSGTFTREDGEPHAIHFSCRARVGSLLRHFADRKAALDGEITMDGLATARPMHGELTIDPVLGRLIRYEFTFRGDDGQLYRFLGQKDVTILDPVGSMTTLPATISDEHGGRVASATLRFDVRDLPSFLGTFRPVF
jgi:hypothetical protein